MLTNHPRKYMAGYILIGLWNVAAGLHPGGAPTWLSFGVAALLGLMAVVCYLVIRKQAA